MIIMKNRPFFVKILVFIFLFFVGYGIISSLAFFIMPINKYVAFIFNSLLFAYLTFAVHISFAKEYKLGFRKISINQLYYLIIGIGVLYISEPFINYLSEVSVDLFSLEFIELYTKNFEQEILSLTEKKSFSNLFMGIVTMALFPAICEELFFRGTIQNLMTRKSKNPFLGIFFTSLIFAIFHINLKTILPILFISFVLGYLYYITKNILIPILIHFLNNGVSTIFVFIEREKAFEQQKSDTLHIILSLTLLIVISYFIFKKYQKDLVKYNIK